MKKIKFKGFSIAELLIVLAIIGIIATMGVTITKKSTENAYNLYIYTGYKAIYEALASSMVEHPLPQNSIYDANNRHSFFYNVKDILEIDDSDITVPAQGRLTFRTKNNINYRFERYFYDGNGSPSGFQYYNVFMTVPAARTSNNRNGQQEIQLVFAPNEKGGILVPIGEVQTRADLLPFKIENGEAKGVVVNNDDSIQYVHNNTNLRGISYREAWCRTNNNAQLAIASTRYIVCGNDVPHGENLINNGVIYLDKHPNMK